MGCFLFIIMFFCFEDGYVVDLVKGGGYLLFSCGDIGYCNNKLCVLCVWNCKIVWF